MNTNFPSMNISDPSIVTHYGTLSMRDDILFVRLKEDLEITSEILEHIHQKGVELSGGKPYCILADISLTNGSTQEARAFGSDNPYIKYHLAYAMLGNRTGANIMANFFIKFNKPKVNTRLFKNEEEAVEWLKSFLPEKVF